MRRIVLRLFLILIFTVSALAGNAAEKPYVIIVSFDGFRWDYPDRGITPNLEKMTSDGVRAITFEPAFPSKTFPNHYTIVTGLYPQNNGLINNRFFDFFKGRQYRVGDTVSVCNAYWYKGEALWETAERQGVISASYFWPGSEVHLSYRHPTYFKKYDGSVPHAKRIQGIIDWLQLPAEKRPHLLFLYFSDTDTYGHRYGPNGQKINEAIRLLDKQIGILRAKIDSIGMGDKVNIILLSDHGMTQLKPDGKILLFKILKNKNVRVDGYGPLVQFFTSSSQEKQAVFETLSAKAKGFTVYKKEDIPEYFHYKNNPFIGDVVAVADLGYTFIRTPKELKKMEHRHPMGDHGYDNHTLDMQGIFFAAGPAFKSGYRCETLHNVDVYPLVCKILGIVPNQKIDGKLERIGFILK